jgi:hypothetical protein
LTRYAPLWQQSSTYPAAVDRGLIAAVWPASGSTGAAVTAVAGTMNVSIAPGSAAVALGANLSVLCRWDVAEVVTLTAAPPSGSSRIDLIVLQVRDNSIDGGGSNDFIFQAIAGAVGTPGPGAVPAVPVNAYAVAQVLVPGAAANLNGATVTSRRSPLVPRDSYACRVWKTAAFTLPTASNALGWDVVEKDDWNLSGINTGNPTRFTAPVAGWYRLDATISTNPAAVGQWGLVSCYKNGTQYAVLKQETFAVSTGNWPVLAGGTVLYLNAGDYVETWKGASVQWNGVVGQYNTFASFIYLGSG